MTLKDIITSVTPYKKIVYIIVACFVGLILLLYTLQGIDSCRFNSDLNKKKEAVNSIQLEANKLEANVNLDKVVANQMIANIKQSTDELLNAVNATDKQREETNQAIANMRKAKQNNQNVNASELEEILENIN